MTQYEKDIAIEDSALDVEWLQHSRLTLKYCRAEAEAEQIYNEMKQALDVVRAELDTDVRSNPDKYGLPKVTETAINGAITISKEYKKAQAEVNDALHNLNLAKAAVRAIYAKKDALENLVRLHGQQYFAGPSVPRDLSKEWERSAQQTEANKKVKINRTRSNSKPVAEVPDDDEW